MLRPPVKSPLQSPRALGNVTATKIDEGDSMIDVVRKAAKAVGSVRRLAKIIDVYRGSLYLWDRVPADHVLPIEEATGGVVDRHQMRPDIYGRPQKSARAA